MNFIFNIRDVIVIRIYVRLEWQKVFNDIIFINEIRDKLQVS